MCVCIYIYISSNKETFLQALQEVVEKVEAKPTGEELAVSAFEKFRYAQSICMYPYDKRRSLALCIYVDSAFKTQMNMFTYMHV